MSALTTLTDQLAALDHDDACVGELAKHVCAVLRSKPADQGATASGTESSENDVSASKIQHGTRCKLYITNALNDYAKRHGYHKRGSVVQVQSETCPIAFETVRVDREDMSFKLFIQQAERALPRLKETLKTSDYDKWATWCATTDHVEFPVLKPDRHVLAFANVAVDH